MKKALRNLVKIVLVSYLAQVVVLVLLWLAPDNLYLYTVWRLVVSCNSVFTPVVLVAVLLSDKQDDKSEVKDDIPMPETLEERKERW